MVKRFAIVTFEGPAGCGKSTIKDAIENVIIWHMKDMDFEILGPHQLKITRKERVLAVRQDNKSGATLTD